MNDILQSIQDEELGEITFKRNLRSKRMSIKILAQSLEVNLPKGFTPREGLDFVNSVRSRLLKKQQRASEKSIVITKNKPLHTLTFDVHVKRAVRKNIFSTLKANVLTIEYPETLSEQDTDTQHYFWNCIEHYLRHEAKRVLPARTRMLAEKYNFKFNNVKIQSSKTRWGSCNSKQVINLSFYLLLLPIHLIDYVILHELCHTKEMNHSPQFWSWMDQVTDNRSKSLRAELKNYSIPKF